MSVNKNKSMKTLVVTVRHNKISGVDHGRLFYKFRKCNKSNLGGLLVNINDIDKEKLNQLASKMGIVLINIGATKSNERFSNNTISFFKTLDISKPNRPEIKEYFQKQLEAIE